MNKVALITGASGGIGMELAKVHAQHKGGLILVARSTNKLNQLKKDIEVQYEVPVRVIPKDLSIPDAAEEVYQEIISQDIQVDYLFNNAGFGDYGLFQETDWEKEEMMINLNVLALTQLTKLFGKDMVIRNYGYIMNVASTAAFFPGPLMSIYYATKHYVLAFTQGIANEWAEFGVKVTALCPGPTESGFQTAAKMKESKLVKGKKLSLPKDVAEFGYDSLLKGKIVAVHGTTNKLFASTSGLLPYNLAAKIVRKIQERGS